MINRRGFCKKALLIAGGLVLPISALELFDPKRLLADKDDRAKVRWGFLVDTYKCVGCGFCVKACKLENDVPYDAKVTRTWVERYVLTRDGVTYIDSPKGARDGFTDKKIALGEDGYKEIRDEDIAKAYFVPKLCNQCDNPPCVQVCPVGATFVTPDGVVLVDEKYCLGCRYCVQACPYGCRFIHPTRHTAQKCTLCYHRITKGLTTACCEACPTGARQLADLKNPNDPIHQFLKTHDVQVLKPYLATGAKAFYHGLDGSVR